MTVLFLILFLPLFPAPSLARTLTSIDLIEKAYRNGEIDYGKALDYKATAVLRPEGLPVGLRSRVPIKSATPIMMEARLNRHLLSPENASLLARGRIDTLTVYYGSGVTLHSYMSPDRHFRIHYTTEGEDAVPTTDDNGNAIPDYVEKFAGILDHVWDKEVNEMGYDTPPSDGIEGGDCLLDVYLADLGAYGFTQIDDKMPVSTVYMILENDYAGFPSGQEDSMKVTAAHEFFHTVQFQITEDIPLNGWWMEASATWMEDHVYPEVNDYVNYIGSWFENPDLPLDTFNGYFEYGTSIWVKHLTEKYGAEFLVDVWNRIKAGDSALAGVEKSLTDKGSTLEEEIKELRVASITLTYDDGQLYRTWRDSIYDEVYPNFDGAANISDTSLDPLAAIYYAFSAPAGAGSLNIDFDGNGDVGAMVIGLRPTSDCSEDLCYDVTEILDNGSIAIKGFGSNGPYTGAVVIPFNYSVANRGSFSLKAAYSLTPSNSLATVTIRPAAASVVSGDGGSGKQQFYLILRDGSSNQILESGAKWMVNSSSPCDPSSALCVDDNGFATAAKAITDATITASVSGVLGSAPPYYSASAPASMTPGAARNCTINSNSDGRCFIATAAFGSPLHPYVHILREFRDRYLLTNDIGRKMVALYYLYSPPAAEEITEDATLRTWVQISLIPVIIFTGFMVKTTIIEKIVVGIILAMVTLIILWKRENGGTRQRLR